MTGIRKYRDREGKLVNEIPSDQTPMESSEELVVGVVNYGFIGPSTLTTVKGKELDFDSLLKYFKVEQGDTVEVSIKVKDSKFEGHFNPDTESIFDIDLGIGLYGLED